LFASSLFSSLHLFFMYLIINNSRYDNFKLLV
jgi:hypothetical protein